MPKTEVGEIITIIKGRGHPEYQVRLPKGEIVRVPHALILPQRTTLLDRGARLLVSHQLGAVSAASTALDYTLPGVVRDVRSAAGLVFYQVELEQGGTFQIDKNLVKPHPLNVLRPGTRVELQFHDRTAAGAAVLKEFEKATITQVDLRLGTLTLRGEYSGATTVRLPADTLRQLQVGETLDMEIQYAPDGKRRIGLARREGVAKPAGDNPTPTTTTAGREGSSQGEREARTAPTRTTPSPTPSTATTGTRAGSPQGGREARPALTRPAPRTSPLLAEADAVGLDPLQLQQVKGAGHRAEIVAFLEKHARDGLIEWYSLTPGQAARFAAPARPLAPALQRAIHTALDGFQDFYQHQAGALDAIRAGRSLVIVTPTASGKTLSYNPAVFETLLNDPSGHVLYVFPLNALMMDQKEKIDALVAALGKEGVALTAAFLRGGLSQEERAGIAQAFPHILAINPEMLAFILGDAQRTWRRFFSGLRLIIVDEVHSYRGLFGVHMTGILRRLLITARALGADPRFVLSSATVHNPLDLASRLTSLPESDFDLIAAAQDGSQQADKHWMVLNPDWGAHSPKFASYQDVAAEVFVEMLTPGNKKPPLNTILFCRSIREVKAMARLVDQRLAQRAPELRGKVKSYVSAELTVEAKRDIYEGLRSGRFVGVISTNALEAGIDIGRLDACLIAGFPFSVMALRQMAGRVGRKEEGLVMFIPFPLSSLDQYYRDHPDLLLKQPPEVFVVDPQNPYIARKHINATAYPGGLSEAELQRYWGERALAIVRQAEADGVMRKVGARWLGSRRDYRVTDDVYAVQNIRSNVQQPFAICPDDGQSCPIGPQCLDPSSRACPRRITTLDRQYVYRDCHPGAVYESTDRRLYRVTALDDVQRVVRVQELPEATMERTFVEADLSVELGGARGRKVVGGQTLKVSVTSLREREARNLEGLKGGDADGVELAWGDATVTRLFTGYYRYNLQPGRRCRRCRREVDEATLTCPTCRHPTEVFYTHSKTERIDFPAPYERGFQIVLKTVACWLALPAALEDGLAACSPCKLPGEHNKVLAWLKKPLDLAGLPARLRASEAEQAAISQYHAQASQALAASAPAKGAVSAIPAQETLLFPGVYGQCLLNALRQVALESRALELFQAVCGYPVTDDLRHICRKCQTSTLLPAMHTLEHVVDARYPSLALGDQSDVGSYTTLGHGGTGRPTIFWFDNYEGGLGAAEKIYDLFPRLMEAGREMLQSCACTTIEGCPRCTYISDCAEGNDDLSKPAGLALIATLLGQAALLDLRPFLYRSKRAADFNQAYRDHETVQAPHGWGEEAPQPAALDPYRLLRLQKQVHNIVAHKAFEVRSHEIGAETPPVSAGELNEAYQDILHGGVLQEEWKLLPGAAPFEVLEVLPSATLKMIQQVYRVIALQVHPDSNPGRAAWANEMMKQLNAAYEQAARAKRK